MTRKGWTVVAAIVLVAIAILLAACGPKVPPTLFVAGPPELPVVPPVATSTPSDTPCEIDGVTAGEVMPCATVERRGSEWVAVATGGGFVVPDSVYEEWLILPETVEVWRTAAVYQRESALDDQERGQAAYADEYTYARELRRKNTALEVAVPAAAILSLFVGFLVGATADEIRDGMSP